jgi:nitrite reductase (NADH) large subunit
MYYIFTADKLTRTATWLEKMEGGLPYLKEVVIGDKLGICEELERRMQHLVDTYKCEWTEVVNDPEKRKLFRQFVNTDETEPGIEFVDERGQHRPADWPKDGVPLVQLKISEIPSANGRGGSSTNGHAHSNGGSAEQTRKPQDDSRFRTQWVNVGLVSDFPKNGGATIRYGQVQIAVYNFSSRGQWYACQNMCPHKNAFVLSRGIIGTADGEPKVACPLHKKPFSLKTGNCLSGEDLSVKVFPAKAVDGDVFVELPPQEQLDALLATELHCITATAAHKTVLCAACE